CAEADGSFEDFVAEAGEGGGDECGDGDGGECREVECSGDDDDDEPVPEVGAVGDFPEIDDGVVGEEPLGEAAVCGFEGGEQDDGGEGDGDAADHGRGVDGGGGEEDHDAERGDGGGADRALVALGDGDEGGDERQE